MGKLKKIFWTIGGIIAIILALFLYTAFSDRYAIVGGLFLLAAFAIVGLAVLFYSKNYLDKKQQQRVVNRTAVVDALKRVFKVVTAEGHFTEIVDFKDTKVSLPLFKSTKKALVIAKAKVLMGYDFSEAEWEINEKRGIVKLTKHPELKIISNSSDLTYYNMENGLFNKFTNEDINVLKDISNEKISEIAWQSDLPKIAAEQTHTLLNELGAMHHWKMKGLDLLD